MWSLSKTFVARTRTTQTMHQQTILTRTPLMLVTRCALLPKSKKTRQRCRGWIRLESKRCPNAKPMSYSPRKESKKQNWQTKATLSVIKNYLRNWRKSLTLKSHKCKLTKLEMLVPGQEPSKRDRQKLIKDWGTPNLSRRSPMAAIRSGGPGRESPSLRMPWSEIALKNAQLYQCLKMINWSTSWSEW